MTDLTSALDLWAPEILVLKARDESHLRDILASLSPLRHKLPARVLATGVPHEAAVRAIADCGFQGQIHADRDGSPLVDEGRKSCISIWRRWLQAFLGARGFKPPFDLYIYLDRIQSPAFGVYEALGKDARRHGMEEWLRVFPICKEPTDVFDRPEAGKGDESPPWTAIERTRFRAPDQAATRIVFDNHEILTSALREEKIHPHFVQIIGGGKSGDDNNRDVFDRMQSPVPGEHGLMSLMGLVESSLLRVLVLDERFIGRLFKEPHAKPGNTLLPWRDTGRSPFKAARYARANIHFLGALSMAWLPSADSVNARHLSLLDPNVEAPPRPAGAMDWPRLSITWDEAGKPSAVRCTYVDPVSDGLPTLTGCEWTPGAPAVFDVAVVHWGLLERIVGACGGAVRAMDLVRALQACCGRVCITSGRGQPRDDELSQLPFIEYSSIQLAVIQELSKPLLGQILMAVR